MAHGPRRLYRERPAALAASNRGHPGFDPLAVAPCPRDGVAAPHRRQDIEDLPPISLVEAQLDAGRLVVAEVRLYGGMHFVVITGHRADILYINDPWFGDRTTLQTRYGSYRQAVHSAQVYYRS